MSFKNRLWLSLALLLAFGLRVYLLDAQSLWNDEGTSVALASLSLPAITNGAARDIHPPLYYYLLHFWMAAAGTSEFAVRFLSVVAGTFLVAVTFQIARSFFDEGVGIIAAFLSAFSPFQVYYSQETRMYIWAALWAALSVYAMVHALGVRSWKLEVGNRKSEIGNPKSGSETPTSNLQPPTFNLQLLISNLRLWLLYIVTTLAALYTHYFAATLILVENLAFAVRRLFTIENRKSKIKIGYWLLGQLVIVGAFVPWYFFAGNQLAAWPAISQPFDWLTLLWRVLNVFSVGLSLEGPSATGIALVFCILFLLGIWPGRAPKISNQQSGIITLILWTLVPVGVMYIVSLSRPAYNPKFLLLATPPFFILAARGLMQFRIRNSKFKIQFTHHASRITHHASRFTFHVSRFTFVSLILISNLQSLSNYYYHPAYARDNYRAIVQTIDANARAGDGILINAPGQIDVVRYYHRGTQPLFLLPRMRPPDPITTRADVDEMLAKVKRLLAIYWATDESDPQGIVETRLAENAFKARDTWHGNVRLAVYGVAPTSRGTLQALDAKVGSEILLQSYRLDAREARAGDVLTLTLNWRTEQVPTARYKVFVHLLDASNRVVAQRDGEPVGDTRITTTWRTGETIADNYGLWIDTGVPPGEYRIEIGMYRVDNGARLPITRGGQVVADHLILETVRVSE